MNDKISIKINKDTLLKYEKYYFNKYPKRKKRPIKCCITPSLNQWSILPRIACNDLKQKWKEFIVWIVNDLNLADKYINNCNITYKFYMPTKRTFDLDNQTPKFINDGLVAAKLLEDDNINFVHEIKLVGGYDKEDPRMEIEIKILNKHGDKYD